MNRIKNQNGWTWTLRTNGIGSSRRAIVSLDLDYQQSEWDGTPALFSEAQVALLNRLHAAGNASVFVSYSERYGSGVVVYGFETNRWSDFVHIECSRTKAHGLAAAVAAVVETGDPRLAEEFITATYGDMVSREQATGKPWSGHWVDAMTPAGVRL